MNKINTNLLAFIILFIFTITANQAFSTTVTTQETQTSKTPQQVLQRLKDGNDRFVNDKMIERDVLTHVSKTASGQYPIAVVLNCMDSRATPEIYFDQGIGDIFVNRVAGNILNSDILAGMEYATKVVGAKLIVVIGHTSCGAVEGACKQVKLGHLTDLLSKIQPAVNQAAKEQKTKDCADPKFVDQIAKDNVLLMMKEIPAKSPVIKQLVQEGKVGIVGAMQDLSTGKVTFIDETSEMPK